MKQENTLVKMSNICKNFGKVQALKNVDFSINKKEIVGLLGDNGAGKSTLIKILIGVYLPNSGEIYFQGERIQFSSPKQARLKGIETCYQDLALVELMSISRNFFLGREPTKSVGPFKLLDKSRMDVICKEVMNNIGVEVRSVDEPVSFLSGGERQSISIGRALHFGAKLLILDEPTAALSIKEANKVLDFIINAREKGLSIIFVTHNVNHVYSVADRFTILTRGENLGDFKKEETNPDEISKMIATGKIYNVH